MAVTPLKQKTRIALRLETEPGLWLERVVLRHLAGTEYLLLATNGDIEKEDLSLPPVLNFRRIRDDRSAVGVKADCLFLTEFDCGVDWQPEELDELIAEADFLIKSRGLKRDDGRAGDSSGLGTGTARAPVTDWIVVRGADGVISGSAATPSEDAVYLGDWALSSTREGSVIILPGVSCLGLSTPGDL